jgi:hypothetical protein
MELDFADDMMQVVEVVLLSGMGMRSSGRKNAGFKCASEEKAQGAPLLRVFVARRLIRRPARLNGKILQGLQAVTDKEEKATVVNRNNVNRNIRET